MIASLVLLNNNKKLRVYVLCTCVLIIMTFILCIHGRRVGEIRCRPRGNVINVYFDMQMRCADWRNSAQGRQMKINSEGITS